MSPPTSPRALVVDDAVELLDVISALLRDDGFDVRTAGDGETAVVVARAFDPDLVVLDVGLPGRDGIETCQELRRFTSAYILMLTARSEEIDKVLGLSVGADDYVTKPFSPRELQARVRALMRRPRVPAAADAAPRARRIGDLTVDPATREITVSGRPVPLTRIEFDLLDVLSREPRVVFTRRQLVERVWGADWYGDDRIVDVHIFKVRRKLEAASGGHPFIKTVRGVGYRLAAPGSGGAE